MTHMKSHDEAKTWTLVSPKDADNLVDGKWVYKTKLNSDGTVERYKARWVARGFTQKYGIDYEESFSPTVRGSTTRFLTSLATQLDLDLKSVDVVNAFPQAKLTENIYMVQPKGYEVLDDTGAPLICKLDKSLYGLMQAARNWNKMVSKYLIERGFKQSASDNCLFTKVFPDGSLLYIVDDAIVAASNNRLYTDFRDEFQTHFQIVDHDDLTWFLGMRFDRDRVAGTTKTQYG